MRKQFLGGAHPRGRCVAGQDAQDRAGCSGNEGVCHEPRVESAPVWRPWQSSGGWSPPHRPARSSKPPPPPAPAQTAPDGAGTGRRTGDLFDPPVSDAPQRDDPFAPATEPLFEVVDGAPLGFAGPSKIPQREVQADSHFIPVEDRWRTPFPEWDRADRGHPAMEDYPYVQGRWWDSYNQHVLKGDYPILGQNTFLELTGVSDALFEPRQLPASNNALERGPAPPARPFFENPNQF